VSNLGDLDRLFVQIKREKGKLYRDRMNQRNPPASTAEFSTQSAQSGHMQSLQLGRVQSLRNISDQIGGMLDADRQPDRRVENTYFSADVSGNAGVGHACGQTGKRLGAAQAHRQLEDLQRVQEFKCGGLPPTM
jgi:hypothetical protein